MLIWHQLPKSPWAEAVDNIPATPPRTGNGSPMAPTPLLASASHQPASSKKKKIEISGPEMLPCYLRHLNIHGGVISNKIHILGCSTMIGNGDIHHAMQPLESN
eukprot:sb/3478068/